jgi:hypothetical protein
VPTDDVVCSCLVDLINFFLRPGVSVGYDYQRASMWHGRAGEEIGDIIGQETVGAWATIKRGKIPNAFQPPRSWCKSDFNHREVGASQISRVNKLCCSASTYDNGDPAL